MKVQSMTETTKPRTDTVTGLVTAGETVFATLTGEMLSDNAKKISTGVLNLVDGMMPTLAARVSFDLPGVLTGATDALAGLDAMIVAARTTKTDADTATAAVTANGAS